MKKGSFLRILALFGVMVLSLVGCKNYDEAIEDLQDQITANKTAIASLDAIVKSGITITSVKDVTGGYEILFSNGTKITLKDAAKAFIPTVGVDDAGFWTIIDLEGAVAKRIKNAAGQDLKAVTNVPIVGAEGTWVIGTKDTGIKVGVVSGKKPYLNTAVTSGYIGHWMVLEDGLFIDSDVSADEDLEVAKSLNVGEDKYLYVGNVKTNVMINSTIFYNTLINELAVALIGENEDVNNFSIALAGDIVSMTTITSIACPKDKQVIELTVAKAVAAADAAEEKARKAFAGISEGDVIVLNNIGSFITNPTEVNTAGYYIYLQDPNEESPISIKQSWTPFNYEDGFTKTKAAAQGGLWALEVAPTAEQLTAIEKEVNDAGAGVDVVYDNLAVIVRKNAYAVHSSYVYSLVASKGVNAIISEDKKTATMDCGDIYNAFADVTTAVDKSDLYKVELRWDAAKETLNAPLKPYVTINGFFVAPANTPSAVTTLKNKVAYLELVAVDGVGNYTVTPIEVTFTDNVTKEIILPDVSFTTSSMLANSTERRTQTVNFSLEPLHTAISSYGLDKKDATVTGTGLTIVSIKRDGEELKNNSKVNKITFEPFVTALKSGTNYIAATAVAAGDKWVAANITLDLANTINAVYTLEYKYEIGNTVFNLKHKITVSNPNITWASSFIKIANLFVDNKISIFGDQDNATGTAPACITNYNISQAYSALPIDFGAPRGDYSLRYVAPMTTATPPVATYNNFINADKKSLRIDPSVMYKEITVGFDLLVFGNPFNKVAAPDSENIIITPKSDVKEGTVTAIQEDVDGTMTDKVMALTYGTAGKLMSDFFVAKSFLAKKDLKAFTTTPDALVNGHTSVVVKATGAAAKLVSVTRVTTSGDFTISATPEAAALTADTEVSLEVSITDRFNQKLVKVVTVIVEKP